MATIPTQNAVPSESARDLKFNAGKIDEFVTSLEHEYKDRFGRCHMTIEGMRWVFEQLMERFNVDINQAIIAAGYIPMDSFQLGAEITKRNEILRDETTGEYYRWDGDLRKSVPAGSTPESTGGVGIGAWVSVGDAALRQNLNPLPRYVSEFVTHQNNIANSKENELRVITFNIYQGDTIANRFGGDFTSMERVSELQQCILKMRPDLIGMQEFYSLYESDINYYKFYPLKNGFFGKAGILNNNRQYGNSYLSKFNLINPTNTEFQSPPSSSDGEIRAFIRAKIIFSGVNIHLFNVHLSFDEQRAKAMIAELASIIQNEDINEPIILIGDWNTSSDEAFLPLTKIGFLRANNNRYDTANNGGQWSVYIDEILYRDITLKDQGTYEIPVIVSDHKPFFSVFEVQ
ncbi:TPA: endonuclease/exonuclease/phosphatase family protein [Morganella morganii]